MPAGIFIGSIRIKKNGEDLFRGPPFRSCGSFRILFLALGPHSSLTLCLACRSSGEEPALPVNITVMVSFQSRLFPMFHTLYRQDKFRKLKILIFRGHGPHVW